jgi:hypothetical protein
MLAAVRGRVGVRKTDANYWGQVVRKGFRVRVPNILHIFGWSVFAEGAEILFHGAPNPLSATLTSRHIETYQKYLVTVFRLSSTQTRIFLSPPSSPQNY